MNKNIYYTNLEIQNLKILGQWHGKIKKDFLNQFNPQFKKEYLKEGMFKDDFKERSKNEESLSFYLAYREGKKKDKRFAKLEVDKLLEILKEINQEEEPKFTTKAIKEKLEEQGLKCSQDAINLRLKILEEKEKITILNTKGRTRRLKINE